MANFGNKNETFAYLVGKDIAELKAKVESIGTTSGGLDVLKVIIPAATDEQINNNATATADLPDEFKNSLLVVPNSYGGYEFMEIKDISSVTFVVDSTTEKEKFIVKLANLGNPKETVRAEIKKNSGSGAESDA